MNTPTGLGTAPGQIADVAVFKNAAYLNSWRQPTNQDFTCDRGGFFSVDITNPAAPRQLAFVPALPFNYHGEGAHVMTFPDGRDVLAVNNEWCTPPGTIPPEGGGFDLYDVTDPADPQPLVIAAGDYGPGGSLICCSPDAPGADDDPVSNDYHSVVMWRDGAKVYLIGVDNVELADVDIFDITDPTAPVAVDEFDLVEEFPGIVDQSAQGDAIFLHDMVVKEIDDVQTLLASYWDAGYVALDVSDPAAPQYIGDSSFDGPDALTGKTPPEGNGHQAEFSHDNQYILAADEDFNPHRFSADIDKGGSKAFSFRAYVTANEGPQPGPNRPIVGDTRFIGEACDPAAIPPASGGVTVAVAVRGTCAFQVKVENAEARGYGAAVIFNNATGATAQCDGLIGAMGFANYTGTIPSVFIARSAGFRMIDAYDSTYRCTPGDAAQSTPNPPAPREGLPFETTFDFDGWGYAHLFRYGSNKFERVDAYAIPEALDEAYWENYGDLSIHEWATDPDQNLAYASYYAGGVRVVSFGTDGIKEVGKFIDEGGSNFWGIEQFTTADGQRLIAASDRDAGLYILKYTPPPPAAAAPPRAAPAPAPATKDASKPRISLLSNARQSIKNLRGRGLAFRITVDEASKLKVTLRGRFMTKSKRGRAKAQRLGTTTIDRVNAGQTVTVVVRPSAALRRKLRTEKRLPAMLSVEATDLAGNVSTRTKSLTFR